MVYMQCNTTTPSGEMTLHIGTLTNGDIKHLLLISHASHLFVHFFKNTRVYTSLFAGLETYLKVAPEEGRRRAP